MSTDVRFYLSYDIKITLKSNFCRINVIIMPLCTQRCYGRHNVPRKSVKEMVVYRFNCMVLFHSETRRHMIKDFTCYKLPYVVFTLLINVQIPASVGILTFMSK